MQETRRKQRDPLRKQKKVPTKNEHRFDRMPADNCILRNLDLEQWPWEKMALDELNDEPERRSEALASFRAIIEDYRKGKTNFNPQVGGR